MWLELWSTHRGKLIGTLTGLFLGFIYLFAGFWDMLVFAAILSIGYWLGKKSDDRESVSEMIYHIIRRWNGRWRMFK